MATCELLLLWSEIITEKKMMDGDDCENEDHYSMVKIQMYVYSLVSWSVWVCVCVRGKCIWLREKDYRTGPHKITVLRQCQTHRRKVSLYVATYGHSV